MIYKYNNNIINPNTQLVINDITHSAGTFLKWTPAERLAFGITEEAEPIPPAPTQAELDAQHNANILIQISQIESTNLMARPMREYLLSVIPVTATQYTKIKAVDDSIVSLRGQLI